MSSLDITRADMEGALRRLGAREPQLLRRTPLMKLPGRQFGLDCAEVWLKLEQLQLGGSCLLYTSPSPRD